MGFSPRALLATGFAPFLATLRAALAHAGGVRIDHIMGLMRLWLIPHGQPAGDGAYLTYPLEDLLNLLALESHRHGAVVIGEQIRLGLNTHNLHLFDKVTEKSLLAKLPDASKTLRKEAVAY